MATGRDTAEGLNLGHEVDVITLGPLASSESAQLVTEVAPQLTDDAKRAIVERGDGVPLFLQELARMLGATDRHLGDEYSGEVEIPSTLHDLLLARLDQLGDDKGLVQVVATIGHSAPLPLLETVVGGDPAALHARLKVLVEAQILRLDETGGEPLYSFEHVLLRDTAYVSQLRSRRREVHASVAEALESWVHRAGPLYLELLAYHLEHAGEVLEAAKRWLEAGQRAAAIAAHGEAVGYYHQALGSAAGAPETPEREALELDVTNALGLSLLAQRGYTSPEVEQTFARARQLTAAVGAQDRVATLFGLWAYYSVRGDRSTSLDLAQHSLATAGQDRFDRPAAMAMLGYDLFHVGAVEQAVEHLEELEALGPIDVAAFPHDMRAATLILLAHARWLLGARKRGWHTLERALEHAEGLELPKGPFSRAYVSNYAAWFCQVAGDSEQALRHATKAIEISADRGYASWLGAGMLHLAIANSATAPAEAIPLLEFGLDQWRQAGAETFRSYFLAGLADAHRRAGNPSAALSAVDEGLAHVERFGEHFHEAELRRIRGELLLDADREAEGIAELGRALDVAHKQHARSFELRAARALGRTSPEGREMLRLVAGSFAAEEGDAELAEARAEAELGRS